jgi:predicted component of type VI protein secretion system
VNAPPILRESSLPALVDPAIDWAKGPARREVWVDPEATWRCLQVAITDYRHLEQRSAEITDQAHRLLELARTERRQTKDRIASLEQALAASNEQALAARQSAYAAEEAARAAHGRLAEAERQTDSLVNLCLDLLETLEPMIAQGLISFESRDDVIKYLRAIAGRPRQGAGGP